MKLSKLALVATIAAAISQTAFAAELSQAEKSALVSELNKNWTVIGTNTKEKHSVYASTARGYDRIIVLTAQSPTVTDIQNQTDGLHIIGQTFDQNGNTTDKSKNFNLLLKKS